MPSKKTVSSSLWSTGKLSLRKTKNKKNKGNQKCKRRRGWLGRAPIAGDLDLGGVCAEELHVRVAVLEQEGHDESPGLPPALQLEQLTLQATLVVRQ